MSDQEIKEKLRKILALAKEGLGGEQANAQELFDALCAKHGIRLEELHPQKRLFTFGYVNKDEFKLVVQLCAVITDSPRPPISKGYGRFLCAQLSEADGFHMQFLYTIYRRQLRKERKRLYSAFLVKHRLFPKSGEVHVADDEEEIEELNRIRAMTHGMDEVHPHKTLKRRN
jgi:hypothetical protein